MNVHSILMYLLFDSTNDELMGKRVVNTQDTKQHVVQIDMCIRTLKEVCRVVESDLTFNCLHKLIVLNMVYFFILWMNTIPVKNGISQEF